MRLPRFLAGLIELTTFAPGVIHMLIAFGYSSVRNFLTTCGVARGIASISIYFTVCSCAMIATRLIAGKLTERFGFIRVVTGGMVMMIASMVCVAFAQSMPLIVLAGLLYGLGNGLVTPILQVVMFRLCAPNRKGAANATYGLFNDVGSGFGSTAWGYATLGVGYTATYLAAAGCLGVGLLTHGLVLSRKLRQKGLEKQERRRLDARAPERAEIYGFHPNGGMALPCRRFLQAESGEMDFYAAL